MNNPTKNDPRIIKSAHLVALWNEAGDSLQFLVSERDQQELRVDQINQEIQKLQAEQNTLRNRLNSSLVTVQILRRTMNFIEEQSKMAEEAASISVTGLPRRPAVVSATEALQEFEDELAEGGHPVADKKRGVELDPPPSTEDPLGHGK